VLDDARTSDSETGQGQFVASLPGVAKAGRARSYIKIAKKHFEILLCFFSCVLLCHKYANPRYNEPGHNGQNLPVGSCEFLAILRYADFAIKKPFKIKQFEHKNLYIAPYLLKARTVKQAETAIAKERLSKHAPVDRQQNHNTQQLHNREAAFSTRSVRKLHKAKTEELLGEVFSCGPCQGYITKASCQEREP
jgi:hypothetical protein